MKYWIAIILCLTVLLAGCQKEKPEDPTQPSTAAPQTLPPETLPPETAAPTTEPVETEPPAPETSPATALADGTQVVLTTLGRGEKINVVDTYLEEYYVVKVEQVYGLIEKRLVRMDAEAEFETWTGYARSGAKLYGHYHLYTGEAEGLSKNTKVQVLDSLGDVYLVQVEQKVGYMRASQVSKTKIKSSSGSSGSDGGDISLGFQGGISFLSTVVPEEGEVSSTGTVLADGAEILLGWYDRGETVQIVTQEDFPPAREGCYTVYLNGRYGHVQQSLVAMDGAQAYAQWDGFARKNAGFYDNYHLQGEPGEKLSTNTGVKVLQDLGSSYLVQVGEKIGYMDKAQVSETKIKSSGGSSGGQWTDPVM